MAKLANLDVEEKEKTLPDEKARGPEEKARAEEDLAKEMDLARQEDCAEKTNEADEEEIAHDGRCIYAVVGFFKRHSALPLLCEMRSMRPRLRLSLRGSCLR